MGFLRRIRLPQRLPAITGRWQVVYALIWVTALALTLVGSGGAALSWARAGAGGAFAQHQMGLDIGASNRVMTVAGKDALAQNVRPGDRVLAIDGQRLQGDDRDDAIFKRLAKPEGAVTVLQLARGAGPPRVVRLAHRRANADALYAGSGLTPQTETWLGMISFLLAPLSLVIGAALLFGRRREPVAAILSLGLLLLAMPAGNAATFWEQFGLENILLIPAAGIGVGLVLLVLLVVPGRAFEPRWTAVVALSLPVGIIVSIAAPGAGATISAAYGLSALVAMIVRYRHQPTEAERQTWRWALLGFVAGIAVLAGALGLYMPWLDSVGATSLPARLWSFVITPSLLAASFSLFVGGVVLSVLRYRLYDTRAAVSHSLTFGIMTAGLVLIFAASEKLIELVGTDLFGGHLGALAGGGAAAIAAALFAPLHQRVHAAMEGRFQPALGQVGDALPRRLAALSLTASSAELASTALQTIGAALSIGDGAVSAGPVLATIGEAPAQTGGGRKAPLRLPLDGVPDGELRLGRRPDGSLPTRSERRALAVAADALSDALRIALARAAREREAAAQIRALAARLDRLEQALKSSADTSRLASTRKPRAAAEK